METTEIDLEQVQQSAKTDTVYVVLQQDAAAGENVYVWETAVAARDAKEAVRFVADRLAKEEEPVDPQAVFVAVPKRYWSALSVKTETHTTITIEDAA